MQYDPKLRITEFLTIWDHMWDPTLNVGSCLWDPTLICGFQLWDPREIQMWDGAMGSTWDHMWEPMNITLQL